MAVQGCPVQELAGADDARVADVDDVRVGDVEPDPEADEKDDPDGEPVPGHEQPQRLVRSPPAAREQEQAHEQVEEERVHERDGHPEIRVVEEGDRDREPEQHEQIEVQQGGPSPPGDEREHEEEAQREPHVQGVDPLPERPRIPARHRPCDLEARPRLGHRSRRVVDVDLGDLPALRALTREPADLPLSRPLRVCERMGAAVAMHHGDDVADPAGYPLDLRPGQAIPGRRGIQRVHEHGRARVGRDLPTQGSRCRRREGRSGEKDDQQRCQQPRRAQPRVASG